MAATTSRHAGVGDGGTRLEAPPTNRLRIAKTGWICAAAGVGLAAAVLSARPAHAAVHHAALVIQHSSGQLLSRCVAFAEDQITGLQLIQRAGVEYQSHDFGTMGSAMCQLDREPSPVPADCFGSSRYWQYSHRVGGGWQTASMGASSSVLHDGDMDGWRYAGGAGQTPGNVTIGSVCSPPAPSVAATHPATTPAVSRPPPAEASASPVSTGLASPPMQAAAQAGSPTPGSTLPLTGPPTAPPIGPALGAWLLFGGATALLVGVGVVNLRRRGP